MRFSVDTPRGGWREVQAGVVAVMQVSRVPGEAEWLRRRLPKKLAPLGERNVTFAGREGSMSPAPGFARVAARNVAGGKLNGGFSRGEC